MRREAPGCEELQTVAEPCWLAGVQKKIAADARTTHKQTNMPNHVYTLVAPELVSIHVLSFRIAFCDSGEDYC